MQSTPILLLLRSRSSGNNAVRRQHLITVTIARGGWPSSSSVTTLAKQQQQQQQRRGFSICLHCQLQSNRVLREQQQQQEEREGGKKLLGDLSLGGGGGGGGRLPSYLESRRSKFSKRFSSLMDTVQSNVFVAGQHLNDLTGYSSIEALKNEIQVQGIPLFHTN